MKAKVHITFLDGSAVEFEHQMDLPLISNEQVWDGVSIPHPLSQCKEILIKPIHDEIENQVR